MISFVSLALFNANAEEANFIAIGALNSDLDQAMEIFYEADLIDENGYWTKKDVTVVQMGDALGNGEQSLELLQWLNRIQKQASRQGADVHVILGDQEVDNLWGELQYVSRFDIESFGGLEERRRAFGQRGEWREWLLNQPAVLDIDGNLFVHGGIPIEYARSAAELSRDIIVATENQKPHEILSVDGPIDYQGYSQGSDYRVCFEVELVLKTMKAQRMIVSDQNPDETNPVERCNGRLLSVPEGQFLRF